MLKTHHMERLFLRLTTYSDRQQIENLIGTIVLLLVMWRSIPKYLFITGASLLTLLLTYLL